MSHPQRIEERAAEAMAFRARECQSTVEELFGSSYQVSFDAPGHTDAETVEHTVDITPRLIARAAAILNAWEAR
jgi:hypothetical protein